MEKQWKNSWPRERERERNDMPKKYFCSCGGYFIGNPNGETKCPQCQRALRDHLVGIEEITKNNMTNLRQEFKN